MKLHLVVPAGIIDAGCSSLATFAVSLFAVRTFTPVDLGAYALLFAAFLVVAVVPTYLVLIPAELETLERPRAQRVGVLRYSLRLGGPWAAGTAILGFAASASASGAEVSLVLPLAVTGTAAAVLSPLQDHLRRVLHLAGASWLATLVSTIQLVAVMAGLGLLHLMGTPAAWTPFGALAVANGISLSAGLVFSLRRPAAQRIPRAHLSTLVRSGRWLLPVELAPTFAGLVVAILITHLASPDALGYAEAARIVAQPLFVGAVGLGAVLGPRSLEAGATGDAAYGQRIARWYTICLVAGGSAYGVIALQPWTANPLESLVPDAYVVPGLVANSLAAYAVLGMLPPYRYELIGGRREGLVGRFAICAGLLQCTVGLSAAVIGAHARPVALLVGSALLWISYRLRRVDLYRPAAASPRPAIVGEAAP